LTNIKPIHLTPTLSEGEGENNPKIPPKPFPLYQEGVRGCVVFYKS
jgi:hypothetical protein